MEMMKKPELGRPAYQRGEIVKFKVGEEEKVGEVYIVDAYGTFGQSEEPSYDVLVTAEECLYKHVRESLLERG